MSKTNKKIQNRWYTLQKVCHGTVGFTFIELIIVVTIMAILSISAWTALSGETEKARDASRLQNLGSIQQSLEQYYIKNGFYPQPAMRDDENQKHAWGYRADKDAIASCRATYDVAADAIDFDGTYCGGVIRDVTTEKTIVGWKGVINELSGRNSVGVAHDRDKELIVPFDATYIQNIGGDPKLFGNEIFKEMGVGEYVYAVYRGKLAGTDLTNGGVQYQLATTLEREGPDERETYIIGNYTQKRGKAKDPLSLIGTGENVLMQSQIIGEDNEKVVNKDESTLKAQLSGKVTVFKEEVTRLSELVSVLGPDKPDSFSMFEDVTTTLTDEVEGVYLATERFDDVEEKLDDVRNDIKKALAKFYIDFADIIYTNLKEEVQSDTTEELKAEVIAKAGNIRDVVIGIQKNSRDARFKDLKEEASKRKELVAQLETLIDEDVADLIALIDESQDSIVDIIPEGIQDVFQGGQVYDTDGAFSDNVSFSLAENTPPPNPSGIDGEIVEGPFKDVSFEVAQLAEIVDTIHEKFLDVNREEKKFNVAFRDIKLDINNLADKAADLEKKAKDVPGASVKMKDLEALTEDLNDEPDVRKQLDIVLAVEQKYRGAEEPYIIDVIFSESILGKSAGQAGVARVSPESEYTGVPYPVDI